MPVKVLLRGDKPTAGGLLPFARSLLNRLKVQQRRSGGIQKTVSRVGDAVIWVTATSTVDTIDIDALGVAAGLYFMTASPSLGDATSATIYSATSRKPNRVERFEVNNTKDSFLFVGPDTYLRLGVSVDGALSIWSQDTFWAAPPVEGLYQLDGTLIQAATVVFDAPEYATDYVAPGVELVSTRDDAGLTPFVRTTGTDRTHILSFAFERTGDSTWFHYVGTRDPAAMFDEPSGFYDQSWRTLYRGTYAAMPGGLQLWGGPSSLLPGWWTMDHAAFPFPLPFETYAGNGAAYLMARYLDVTDTPTLWGLLRVDLITGFITVAASRPYGTTTGFKHYDALLESPDEFGYVLANADAPTDGQQYDFYIGGVLMFSYDVSVLNPTPAPARDQECKRFWRVKTGVYGFALATFGVGAPDRQYDVIGRWSADEGVTLVVQSTTPKERIILTEATEYGELGPWVAYHIFDGATLTSGKLQLVNVVTGKTVVTDHDADGGNSRAILVAA